ncbi:MAG: 3-phosphoshikimate 1-carboxyvinyltransferase [Candidatus Thermoplasmatota archaeon]|nr:3-phosphoshikimate 1-carboxyvinyltransferase [Candidatus Thermoplasmatota archaeon]
MRALCRRADHGGSGETRRDCAAGTHQRHSGHGGGATAVVVRPSVPKGNISAPPSKSYTHRAMVLGALSRSHMVLKNPLISEDTKATLDALYAMGTEIGRRPDGLMIHCEELRGAPGTIDARNSGTTMRLIAGVASLLSKTTTLTGDDSLVKRPMSPLIDALEQLGAKCEYLKMRGTAPLRITGPITKGEARLPGDISSQFVSSLLIACTHKQGDTSIQLESSLRSRPYVDITLEMIRAFGGTVDESGHEFRVKGEQELARDEYLVPGDYSSAAFPLAAAAITGGEVTVRDLDQSSPQGDKAIVELLSAFGAVVSKGTNWVKVAGKELKGVDLDVRHTPDLFPILAVLGSVASGTTRITGGENLREKESDRIESTTAFLRSMGADITPTADGCVVRGVQKLKGATVQTMGDHRIMMAAAVAGFACGSETRIEDEGSFSVSYPGFIADMHQLGCRMEVRR